VSRKFFHFTPRLNAGNITRLGLRVDYHRGGIAAIWLCQARMLSWSLAHIRSKYQVPREQLVCYECSLPSSWVFKVSRGIWICYRDIPIERLAMVTT
jgi:hypothetical protein